MKIVNVVAVATLDQPLDLPLLHSKLVGSSFPEKSHWLRMRLEDNTYIAFYRSGKFLITQKHPDALKKISNRVVKKLKEISVDVKVTEIKIHNIVVMESLPLKITLEDFIANLDPKHASYEPEQFPALVYKEWGVSFLLFSRGKVIVTGAKTVEKAEEGIKNF